MTAAIFVHDEMLNPDLAIFREFPDALRFFVYDDQFLLSEGWTIKRIQFVADGLLEIPRLHVFRGSTRQVISQLGSSNIVTQETPNVAIRALIEGIDGVGVTYVAETSFVTYSGSLARFSQYWKSIEKQLL
jgi:hypothetical protein